MKKLFLVISVFIGLLLTNIDCQAQKVGGELGNLAAIKKGFRNRRISSTDKNGNNGALQTSRLSFCFVRNMNTL